MAEQILKKLKYGGSEVQVESAIRDGAGKIIADTYSTKAELTAAQQSIADRISPIETNVTDLQNNTVKNTGDQTINGSLVVTGNHTIQGDLVVKGSTITADQETLLVKDNIIVTNSDGATLPGASGLAIRIDSTNAYGIMYNPASQSVELGQGTVSATELDNEFTFTSKNAVAVRQASDQWTADHIAVWDSSINGFKDGGAIPTKLASPFALTAGSKTYDGSEAVEITAADLGALTAIPQADTNTLGGIKLGYDESAAAKTYKVQKDANGNAFVAVPWTDTQTGAATADALGGIKLGYEESGNNYAVQLDGQNKAFVTVPKTVYNIATVETAGLVKPVSVAEVTGATTSTVAARYYNVVMNSAGNMFVNVPWTDNITTTDVTLEY